MATDTARGSIGGFHTWIFVTHEMCCIGDEIVVAVVGAKVGNTKERNGITGGTDIGSRRGYSGGFVRCRAFHPSSAAEGGRVDGSAGKGAIHIADFDDVPTGEITGKGGGTIKRVRQSYHFLHLPCAQITSEG